MLFIFCLNTKETKGQDFEYNPATRSSGPFLTTPCVMNFIADCHLNTMGVALSQSLPIRRDVSVDTLSVVSASEESYHSASGRETGMLSLLGERTEWGRR